MEVLILFLYLLLFWYLVNIIWLVIGFQKVPVFRFKATKAVSKFTIVVPFRNEKENLPILLESIAGLQYPKHLYEVILVDDASDDGYDKTLIGENMHWMDNQRTSLSPKKDAIQTAITLAKMDWIVTTDADCVLPENWLGALDACIQKENPKMIASGVVIEAKKDFLSVWQQMDMLSLQGVTIGSFGNKQAFMCNGANFCYQKSFFQELNGFEGNANIASGDDVFLLQKAMQYASNAVFFLKSTASVVSTSPESSWKSLFFQRVRWASKTANYGSFYSKQLAFSVFFMNLILVLLTGFLPFHKNAWEILLWLFAIKFWVDFLLLRFTASFFQKPLRYLLFSSVIYPFFAVMVTFYALFGKYTWKGRVFKK